VKKCECRGNCGCVAEWSDRESLEYKEQKSEVLTKTKVGIRIDWISEVMGAVQCRRPKIMSFPCLRVKKGTVLSFGPATTRDSTSLQSLLMLFIWMNARGPIPPQWGHSAIFKIKTVFEHMQ